MTSKWVPEQLTQYDVGKVDHEGKSQGKVSEKSGISLVLYTAGFTNLKAKVCLCAMPCI